MSSLSLLTASRGSACSLTWHTALVALALLSASGEVDAAEFNARSAALADVNAAISLAKDGDTVNVPAGTVTWNSTLSINKNITLAGAGASSNIIINGITGPSSRPPLVSIQLSRDLPFRMTGFTFRGGTATARNTNGEVRIAGVSHSFRIDHCTFDRLQGVGLSVFGFLWGVIDHCTFYAEGTSGPIQIMHRDWNGKNWGHGSWADDPYWGSEKFVFIEDCYLEGRGIDSFEGARFVVRYNRMHNCGLVMHGTGGQGRSAKQCEEYNNTYHFDQNDSAGQIRGGSLITHDNTWTHGILRGHPLQDYRYYSEGRWGIANGQNVYDLNAPNGATGYWAAGTHTGADGATTLEDTDPGKVWWDEAGVKRTGAWPANRWLVPGVAYIIRNITKEQAGTVLQSWTLSNNSNSVTYSPTYYPGKQPLTFKRGDTYEIWKVARLLDQPGLGKGDLLTDGGDYGTADMATPKAWPRHVNEPCYSWNNKDGSGKPLNLETSQASMKEGRDFFNGTPKPGYTPYTYPHPLVSGSLPSPTPGGTPRPPTDLRIVPGS